MTRRRKIDRLTRKSTELAVAAPQVVARRLTRMARAGAMPDARDRGEFVRMGTEKVRAFGESWFAMILEAWRAQIRWLQSWMTSAMSPAWASSAALSRLPSAGSEIARWRRAWIDIASAGMAPVHRRAVGNARRLARSRRG